jgi:hypothetical protein
VHRTQTSVYERHTCTVQCIHGIGLRFIEKFIYESPFCNIKGIVSQDFEVCFLLSFNRTHKASFTEHVLLPGKFCFCVSE